MNALLRCALLVAALCGCACGPTVATCSTTCDCANGAPPDDQAKPCDGEWTCGAEKTCQWTCFKTGCSGQIYTCPEDTDCNGSFCSARKFAACSP